MNDTNLTYHIPLLFDELMKKRSEREMKNRTEYANRYTNDKLTG